MGKCNVCNESHRDGGLVILSFGLVFSIFPLLNPEWEGAPIFAIYGIILLGLVLLVVAGLIFDGRIHLSSEN